MKNTNTLEEMMATYIPNRFVALNKIHQKYPPYRLDYTPSYAITNVKCGVYFLGQTSFNPHTGEKLYAVKIGMSRNMPSRMKSYYTDNPFVWHIDYKEVDQSVVEVTESTYHSILLYISGTTCKTNQEWYLVSEEMYMEMCEKGFRFFE